MLSREDNALLTRVDRGTPMGDVMRRYWIPALLAREVAGPDGPPVRVKLLGEELVAFRDTSGRIGLLDEFCPHRRASLFFGRNEACGLRCVRRGTSPRPTVAAPLAVCGPARSLPARRPTQFAAPSPPARERT